MVNFSSFLLNISHLSIFNTEDTLLYYYTPYCNIATLQQCNNATSREFLCGQMVKVILVIFDFGHAVIAHYI